MPRRIGRILLNCFVSVALLAGCASVETDVDPVLKPFANTVLDVENNTAERASIVPAQPEPYVQILAKKYEELKFGADNNIRTLEISRLSNKQGRLPQLIPGASVGTNNELNLRVQQVLFDGGIYRAKFHADDHLAVLRQIEFLRDLNEKASGDIAIFLSYRKNLELGHLLTEKSAYLEKLLRVAKTRANGGVGDASDVSLFELKLSEMQTDAQIARADAQSDLVALGSEQADAKATDFVISETHLPLTVVHAIAKHAHALSDLELTKKERNPKVILEGRLGMDPFFGNPKSNIGVTVDKDPIAIGGNTNVLMAEQQVLLEQHNLDVAIRDAQRETDRIRARVTALESQLARTSLLSQQASYRFHDFSQQFQAGTAELSEAAGLVQTLRHSTEKTVTLKYQILDLQRQLAEQGGHFWTFES